MKKLLSAALLVLGLSGVAGCEATYYDDPPVTVASGCVNYVYPADAVVVEPCAYYRVIVVDGVPTRYYYRWTPGHGWYGYDHVVVHEGVVIRGGGYYHGGEFHGGYHGGRR
jgi:hypothetical protein